MAELARMTLPAGLNTGAAAALARELSALRGCPLSLDASGVESVGALGLQVLLSARLTWLSDGQRLELERPSEALTEALALAGASPQLSRSA